MLKKMLSLLLSGIMLLSLSVPVFSAQEISAKNISALSLPDEVSTDDEVLSDASFDEAYAYLISAIEATKNVNEKYYTDESFKTYANAREDAGMAHLNAYNDMFTADDLIRFADNLLKAYENLEYLIFGDPNCDTRVNVKDATEIQKHLADLVNLSEKRLLCADVDKDGENNIKDVTLLQKFLAGIIRSSEIKYIELDFYIIDLKVQLLELMEYAELYTTGTPFEAKGYEKYVIAMGKAVSAYRDKWPFEENAQDVLDAINGLDDALDNLIVELPIVFPTDGEIEYVDEYEFRVGTYNHEWENVNVIVRSPEELEEELQKVDINAYERNEDIFPEKYDDAFFEENVVIMSFCMVGGSGCSQWVYSLEIDGTALIVHRSINRPEIYPPDMNYTLTYLEVKKDYLEGLTMIINKTNGEYAENNPIQNSRKVLDVKDIDEYRVGPYNHNWEPVWIIPQNPDELQEFFGNIDTDYYDSVMLPDKYDEDFFEEHGLIVTLFVIGGSGSNQSFGRLMADGDTVTVERYITQPTSGPCDMDYRLTLFVVDKEDLEGITQIENEIVYEYIEKDLV